MRAGRLVTLLLMLERQGRMTATQLSIELEVSVRTVLRDIDELSGAGVPVFAVRGPNGGFELLEGYRSELTASESWGPRLGRQRRATVTITPEGRRLAAVMQVLQPIRLRSDDAGDIELDAGQRIATFRLGSLEATARDVLMLGPEVEVLEPPTLRERVADLAEATARRYHTASEARVHRNGERHLTSSR